MGKQAIPRNVQGYCSSFNVIIDRFVDHIAATRAKDGTISDITMLLKLLLIES